MEKADETPLLSVLGLGSKWGRGYVPLLSPASQRIPMQGSGTGNDHLLLQQTWLVEEDVDPALPMD